MCMEKSLFQLRNRYEAIVAALHCDVNEEDYAKLGQRIEDIRSLASLENRSISLYDVHRRKFILKVDRHHELLGYNREDGERLDDIGNYHSRIHPSDISFLYDSEIRAYEYLSAIRNPSKKDYKLVYDYRVRAKNGEYIRFLHQMALFELDRRYNSWIVMVISDVLSIYPDDQAPRRYLLDTRTNRVLLFNEESGIRRYLLTPAEQRVLRLVAQGFDSGQIGRLMKTSVNTVNNHRQHILEKTATKNTAQAIMYLHCIGVLY